MIGIMTADQIKHFRVHTFLCAALTEMQILGYSERDQRIIADLVLTAAARASAGITTNENGQGSDKKDLTDHNRNTSN